MDTPPCLKVTHKTFGTQTSNDDMICCRLSMPVEFHSGPRKITDINEVIAEGQRAKKDDVGKIDYGSITKVKKKKKIILKYSTCICRPLLSVKLTLNTTTR